MHRVWQRVCGLAVLLVACGPIVQGGPAQPGQGPAEPAPGESRKTIVVAALNSVKGFSPWLMGTTGGGSRSLYELHTNGLVSTDARGGLEARVAARLPTLQDGTIAVLPDGRMQTTWRLRAGVKWHDGTPFTVEDVVFSWQVNTHPEIPAATPFQRELDHIAALDPATVVITWKTTFYRALHLGFINFWLFPKHLLGDTFERDKQVFLNLPSWTTEYVHLGSFRLVDFGLGENLIFERFDDYFLGRPKAHRIIIRIIPDPSTLYANLRAGTVDIATESTLPEVLMAQLRDEWKEAGGGVVVQREGAWSFLNVQYNPEFQRVPELRQDVRIRRGLLAAIDRDTLRGVTFPGFPDTEPDSFMPKSDPRAPLVGTPFARHRYDPALAVRELAEAGWRRGPDGQMGNQAGDPIEIPIRSTAAGARQVQIIAQAWRDLGLRVAEEAIPGSLVSDRFHRASFPGLEHTAQNSGDDILARFDSRQCPRPPRYASPPGCYTNPELDRLVDRLYGTIDLREQGLVLREVGELLANDLAMMPTYFSVSLAAVRKGVVALDDFKGAALVTLSQTSRNAHLWDQL